MTDFTVVLTDLSGVALQDEIAKQSNGGLLTELTLGAAAAHALCFAYADEVALEGADKFKRGMLAQKVLGAVNPELTADEKTLMRKMIAKLYGAVVVFRAWSLIDEPKTARKR